MKISSLLFIAFISMSVLLNAQHHDDHSQVSGHGDGHPQKNHLAVFLGSTTNFNHHSSYFSVGLDYEYKVTDWLGLGLTGEVVFAESEEIIAGIPIFFHPAKGLIVVIAPLGVFTEEYIDSHEDPHSYETPQEAHKEIHFGVRLGVGYDFHLGKLSIGPAINYDISNTSALEYGINIGIGF